MRAIRNALILFAILTAGYISAQATPPNVVNVSCVVTGSACASSSLRGLTSSSGLSSYQSVYVSGYYAPGDGGGGQFAQVGACTGVVSATTNTNTQPKSITLGVSSTTGIVPGMGINSSVSLFLTDETVVSVNSSTNTITLSAPTSNTSTQASGAALILGGNGGNIIMDGETSMPTCFQRMSMTGSVLEWGAKCDVVQPGGVLSTFGTPPTWEFNYTGTPFDTSDANKNIVIAGAGNTITAYVTNGSPVINFGSAPGAFHNAQITGSGISNSPVTTVSGIGTFLPSGLTGDTSGPSSLNISVSSTVGIAPGMAISGIGLPAGDTIAAVTSGTGLTLTLPTNGSGVSGTSITISGQTITLSSNYSGTNGTEPVVIHGAVLASTISSVDKSGKHVFLNSLADAAQDPTPNYYAVVVKAVPNGGGIVNGGTADYMVGDLVTLDDLSTGGTVLQVQDVQNGAINGSAVVNANGANVLTQKPISAPPSNPRYQYMTSYRPSTGGTGGNGANFTMSYTGTGVYWFGSDDTFAIQNALNYAGTLNSNAKSSDPLLPGTDVWLPENRMCGITKTIQLPLGNTTLRGWNQTSSGLVALAYMPQDPTNSLDPNTYVVMTQSTSLAGGTGGGMRDLSIEGFQLADYVVGDLSGERQTFRTVRAKDAMPYTGSTPDPSNPSGAPLTSEWLYGAGSGIQVTGIVFDDIQGVFDFNQFPLIAEMPDYSFTTKKHGTGAVISNSIFSYSRIPIADEQTDWNLYLGDYVNDTSPFTMTYCVEAGGKISVVGLYCDSPSSAAVHIASTNVSVVDLFARWGNYIPTSTTYGVLIDGGLDYDNVTDVRTGSFLTSAANVVAMNTGVGSGTIGQNTIINGNPGASLTWPLGVAASVGTPEGRLTLQSGAPVMTSAQVGVSTLYYAPYVGPYVPIFNGTTIQAYNFTSGVNDNVGQSLVLDANTTIITGTGSFSTSSNPNQITIASGLSGIAVGQAITDISHSYIPANTTIAAIAGSTITISNNVTGTTAPTDSLQVNDVGFHSANTLFDVFEGLNNGVPTLCTGPAWVNSGAGTSSRGTAGGTTVLQTFQGILTNQRTLLCRFGSSMPNWFTCVPNKCTYLGTLYTTAVAQTSFNPNPAAANGGPSSPNAGVYFWNAYNRVPAQITEQDNGTPWTCITCGSWEPADAGSTGGGHNNRINIVDGLQQTSLSGTINQPLQNSSGPNPHIGIVFDSISATPANYGQQNNNILTTVSTNAVSLPLMGLNYAQAMQKATVTGTANFNSDLFMTLDWQY